MEKYLSPLSVFIFIFNLLVYILFFSGIDLVPDDAVFPLIICGSIAGAILAWYGRKGIIRYIGISSNITVLFFTVIIPLFVRMFIWNKP